jgi:hypothetical protein
MEADENYELGLPAALFGYILLRRAVELCCRNNHPSLQIAYSDKRNAVML